MATLLHTLNDRGLQKGGAVDGGIWKDGAADESMRKGGAADGSIPTYGKATNDATARSPAVARLC